METILGSASHTFRSYFSLIGLQISPGCGGTRRHDYVYQFLACPQDLGVVRWSSATNKESWQGMSFCGLVLSGLWFVSGIVVEQKFLRGGAMT